MLFGQVQRRAGRNRDGYITASDSQVIKARDCSLGVLPAPEMSIGGGQQKECILVLRIDCNAVLSSGCCRLEMFQAELRQSEDEYEEGGIVRVEADRRP